MESENINMENAPGEHKSPEVSSHYYHGWWIDSTEPLQVAAEDYGQLVDRENINREEAGVDASGMEAAIAALVVGDSTPDDKHPEK